MDNLEKLRGKMIVIEGTDGSGKTTQLNLLKDFFIQNGEQVEVLDFPQYDQFWGKLVGRFLAGEFGDMDDVSPYLVQPLYMLDQATAAAKIKKWKSENKIILSNRYITSSLGHQIAKVEGKEKDILREWIVEAGYNQLGVAKEDVVIFLYVPTEVSFKLAKSNDSVKRKSYAKGKEIAEDNFSHQQKSAEAFLESVKLYSHWHKIDCIDTSNNLLPVEQIHERVKDLINNLN